MRMRKIRILLPVLLIGLMTAVGQTGYYIPSERFSSGLINDLCQDQYGYMWIATDYGLNKFDGYRFTTYLNHEQDTTTIGNNVVDYVFCDRDGQPRRSLQEISYERRNGYDWYCNSPL